MEVTLETELSYTDRVFNLIMNMPCDHYYDLTKKVAPENMEKFIANVKLFIDYDYGRQFGFVIDFSSDYSRLKKFKVINFNPLHPSIVNTNMDIEFLMNELPENRPLYCDSGLWQLRSDDMEDVLYQQTTDETFMDFVGRVVDTEASINYLRQGN